MAKADRVQERRPGSGAPLRGEIKRLRAQVAELERARELPPPSDDALQRERDLIASVLDVAAALVVVLDREGRIVRFNRACEQTTGYTLEEVRGEPLWKSLLLPEEVDAVRGVFESLRAGHFPNRYENYWRTKDGRRRLIAWSNTAIVGRDGAVEYVIGTGIDITERRLAEGALRASDSLMRCVVDTVVDGIITIDERGLIQSFNPAAERIFGYGPEEIIGQNVRLLMPPPFCDQHDAYLARYLHTGEARVIGRGREVVGRRKDGRTFPMELAIGVTVLDQRRLFTGIVRDITERKQAEESLRESQRVLATLMGNLPGMAYRCRNDPDWTMEFVSEGSAALTGHAPAELIDNAKVSFAELIHRDDRQTVWDEVQAALRENRPYQLVYRITPTAGEQKWVWEQGVGVSPSAGGELRLEGFITDITERKRAEEVLRLAKEDLERRVGERTAALKAAIEQLREEVRERRQAEESLRASEQRLRTLCASAPIGIFEADASGRCVYRNERVATVCCGMRAGEFWGDAWQRCAHPQDREAVEQELRAAYGAGRPFHREFRLICSDGEVRWAMVRTALLNSPRGKPMGIVGTVEDVTERRRAEEQIRRREIELAYVSRINTAGEMAAMLAHELNQPLTAINNYSQAGVRRIRTQVATLDDLVYAFERIAEEASRASQVIGAIRTSVSKHKLNPTPVNLNELVGEAVRLAGTEVRHWAAELRLGLSDGLPLVAADRVQVEQVILNLLRNGLEAMEHTPVEHRVISIQTARRDAREVEVAVQDRGVGLASEAAGRMFEPFFSTKANGMGIGLSICRSIVQGHGGRLWVESEPGAGATFRFTLPVSGRNPSVERGADRLRGG